MPRHLPFLLAASMAVMSTAATAASIVIDSFDNTNFQVVGAPTLGTVPVNPATTSGPTSDAIGGVRTITNTRTLPGGTGNAFGQQVQTIVTGGNATVSLGAGTEGFSVFSWNAGGVDLTDGGLNTRIELTVLDADLATNFAISVGGQMSSQTTSAAGILAFEFADYVGVDFSNVGAIDLTVSGLESFDTTFDLVQAVSSPSTVPLPAGLPLLLAALGTLGWMRQRTATT